VGGFPLIIKIELELSLEQWIELYYSVESKLANVKSGIYDEDGGGTQDWEQDLSDLLAALEKRLAEAGIDY